MVNEVINILNEQITDLVTGQAVYGLAQTVLRKQGTEREMLPCIVSPDGEGKYVGIDDVKSLITYHKLNSATSTQIANGKGDNPGDISNTYTLSLLIYWDRKRFNKQPDELLMLIQARWPQVILNMPDTKSVGIRITNSIMNSQQIYSQEYQLENPNLPANIHLMQINYNIEIKFNPACVEACP
jgi:hypothetical protein